MTTSVAAPGRMLPLLLTRRQISAAMLMMPLAAIAPSLARSTSAASGTSDLAPDERLYQTGLLRSPNGLYTFEMQIDGNATIYAPGHVAIWSTGTAGRTGAWLLNQASDGNLVLRDSRGVPLWHTHTNGRGRSTLILQDDANLVMYTDTNPRIPTWASGTAQPAPTVGAIPAAPETAAFNARVLDLVNAHRQAYGLTSLRPSSLLANAAQRYAVDMASYGYFSHTGRDDSNNGDRIAREGYRYAIAGENLARGYTTPEGAVGGWMASPSHRANILSAQFTEVGLGYYSGIWVQELARPA